jgi:hypothetical protein
MSENAAGREPDADERGPAVVDTRGKDKLLGAEESYMESNAARNTTPHAGRSSSGGGTSIPSAPGICLAPP